ncbi:Protein of unknown function, putative methyltransferase [Flavobacterium indicum GPTSA100-9 = DSM 17447]|uniref:Uncharacterized protein n=1 Tax=Flavobacterium indicum (strain DSM 17447 / CIP 109464 / GPTSA100-9) TaxID=1094466 RepID=H8XPK9_FLAIG|nr:hypothetical protein [Flavobacterium indicum]CCG53283.1 Protein of unknown function, putative methyltransferase [Flavobacterium indicum GPTSA100-9 = DSM 17447]
MNKEILSQEIQEFITVSLDTNIAKLALSKNPFPNVEWKEIINQIVSKNKSKNKLPTWFNCENIYYPQSISIEQTSSEQTAKYKSDLITGTSIIDLTGGFGVDCYYFSKSFHQVTHCELNEELSKIVDYNFKRLNITNILCVSKNSTDFLNENNTFYDYIYIDPSRRSNSKGKVFLLKDCLPNVPENLEFYFTKTNHILIKTAPILDISAGINELSHIKSIHIIALENEVKELLWVLDKNYAASIEIKAVNIQKEKTDIQTFEIGKTNEAQFSLPKKYIYEPNAAILKSGCVDDLCNQLHLEKLQQHSHLFTSNELVEFPGRRFKIEEILPFQKAEIKKHLQGKKMNITIRNFPLTVEEIRKKYKILDGGSIYSFFTTNRNEEKIVLICTKL